jgi:hypothetical protein
MTMGEKVLVSVAKAATKMRLGAGASMAIP